MKTKKPNKGLAFHNFNKAKHVVEPFEIPDYWTRTVGIDFGTNAPFCALWVARNPDNGRVVVYKELYSIISPNIERNRNMYTDITATLPTTIVNELDDMAKFLGVPRNALLIFLVIYGLENIPVNGLNKGLQDYIQYLINEYDKEE